MYVCMYVCVCVLNNILLCICIDHQCILRVISLTASFESQLLGIQTPMVIVQIGQI